MFRYYQAENIDVLADRLVDEFSEHQLKYPLEPRKIVVQNHGMAHWLSLYVAEKQDIAANLKFEFPAERIWSLIRLLNPEIPEKLPSDRKPMSWALLELLDGLREENFSLLTNYIENAPSELSEIRCWKLAQRISDVFDQYLTYRTAMIDSWEQGELVTDEAAERWQLLLWNKMQHHWEQNEQFKWGHQAQLYRQLLSDLKSGKYDPEQLPEQIIVFGVGSLPPIFLDIFVALGRWTDVIWFRSAPTKKSSSDLLESMASKELGFNTLLNKSMGKFGSVQIKKSNLSNSSRNTSLLGRLQQHILSGNIANNFSVDDTVQIHSSHSPMREVEILRDQLLALLDDNPEVEPSNILVLTPDLTTYAPLIEAVFGSVEEEMPHLPYHITERPLPHTRSVHQSFKELLKLATSRFKAPDVLEFLGHQAVSQQFGLTPANLNTIEKWVDETGIKWGVDGEFKQSEALPDSDFATWSSGLNRMLLGYIMHSKDDELFGGIHPYGEIEGIDSAELAGKLTQAVRYLFEVNEATKGKKTLEEWSAIMLRWVDSLFSDEEPFTEAVSDIRQIIQQFAGLQNLSRYTQPVSFSVVTDFLLDELQEATYSRYSGEGITISSLVAMRNIPADVIALIGMNEQDFPRSKVPSEFDLIAKNPQPGDRRQRLEDRQFFLDAVLAAKHSLYISYISQSNKQDATFPPSVVVSELVNYLKTKLDISVDNIVQSHPLQPFSIDYFINDSGREKPLFSYSKQAEQTAKAIFSNQKKDTVTILKDSLPEADESRKNITVEELARFFQHPSKFLLQNRLDIYLREDRIMDDDREVFKMEGLDRYELEQKMLAYYLKHGSLKNYPSVARAHNILPEGRPGRLVYRDKVKEIRHFADYLQKFKGNESPGSLEVDFSLSSFNLTGKLNNLFTGGQLLYRFGRPKPKNIVESWVRHLAYLFSRRPSMSDKTVFLAFDDGKIIRHQFQEVSEPKQKLVELLNEYWRGLHRPTPFFPETSYKYAKKIRQSGNKEEAISSAGKTWINSYKSFGNEGEDPYNIRFFRSDDVLQSEQFQQLSTQIWIPILDNMQKEKM